LADADETNTPVQPAHLFSIKGRIGRLRYACWTLVLWGLCFVVELVINVALRLLPGFTVSMDAYHKSILIWITIGPVIPFFIMHFLLATKRNHDMNSSGLICLVACILMAPFAILVWAASPSTKKTNRYGSPPPPVSYGVKIGGSIGIFLIVAVAVGSALTVVVHAYQGKRVRSHSVVQVQPHGTQNYYSELNCRYLSAG
jgi:uncharacterized membrane protein YhaH (DUF805 family)